MGLTIAGLERSGVMKNWEKRRCEFPVMAAATFFKPEDDSRSSSEFAADNFTFCMKSYVQKFVEISLTPFQALFGKQMETANTAGSMINNLRQMATTMYNAFMEIIDVYFRRFMVSVFEMSRIVQYLRMSMRRLNAVMMSMLYSAMTVFRGMVNFIQTVIKVILIICGILIALLIILWFVLFPVIPIIISTLGAIIFTILAMSSVVAGSTGQALSMKDSFCFSDKTNILIKTTDENNAYVPVSSIKIGQELGNNCGKVTAVIMMNGEDIPLYNLKNIYVSGSHLVLGTDNIWKSVETDERAIKTNNTSKILYCFNTTSQKIPVISPTDNSIILFRDWEEIDDEDKEGQYLWQYFILSQLNNYKNYDTWKVGLKAENEVPVISPETLVKTINGFIPISSINLNDILLDRNGIENRVLGIIDSIVSDINDTENLNEWHTELFELKPGENVWIKGNSTLKRGSGTLLGKTIITESGEYIIWDSVSKTEKIVRDFTDIGYNSIHKTYPFVSERLRLSDRLSKA